METIKVIEKTLSFINKLKQKFILLNFKANFIFFNERGFYDYLSVYFGLLLNSIDNNSILKIRN